MKNSEIHGGLPQSEIRDFLAMSLVRAFQDEVNNKKETIRYEEGKGMEYAIRDTEAQIAHLQKSLEIKKRQSAILLLAGQNGWEEFDVSDETLRDLSFDYSMSFLGTKAEHATLLKQIKNKK